MLRKGGDRKVNDCGISDVLMFANRKDKNADGSNVHDSQKPIGLFRTLIIQSTNEADIVLDPFIGSGTTAIAAIKENRHFIGMELNKEYYDIACERIKKEQEEIENSLFNM